MQFPVKKTLFVSVAEMVLDMQARQWKPTTLAVSRSYLRNQILPFFGHRPIAEIDRNDVLQWFATLRLTPAAANRALPVLSTILRVAESLGIRPGNTNPCYGVRRYRIATKTRILTTKEIYKLGSCLNSLEHDSIYPVSAIRLLLLTGCRQGEIRHLRWTDYRHGHLFLRDSKTGPRTVWLSSASRSVLAKLPRRGKWIFPDRNPSDAMRNQTLYRYWYILRDSAALGNVRLHDLRHTYASFALQQGETVLTIGRLLGHRDPSTTLKYLHFDDTVACQAAQTVATAMGY